MSPPPDPAPPGAAERPARTVPLADGPVAPWLDRLVAVTTVAVALGCLWFLWQAAPDGRGHGTHEQLGLEPCGWARQGFPCPTCGVTTAACHVAHGQFLSAVVAQPFGAALAIGGLLAAVVALYCLVRRRAFVEWIGRLPLPRLVVYGVLLLLASWLYKYLTFVP